MIKFKSIFPVIVPLCNILSWCFVIIRYILIENNLNSTGVIIACFYLIISVVHLVLCLVFRILFIKNNINIYNINRLNTFIQAVLVIVFNFYILALTVLVGAYCIIIDIDNKK